MRIETLLFDQWGLPFFIVLFSMGGVLSLAIGMGLLLNTERTLRFMNATNRWVSLRRAFRPIEIPRDTRPAVEKHRRWLSVVLILGAIFTIFILTTRFDARMFGVVFAGNGVSPPVAAWMVDAVRWLLIAGNVFAIGLGIMLCFFPGALSAFEARGSHWYSHRKVLKRADTMNLALDQWIVKHPRFSGAVITIAGLILVGNFGVMWLGLE